MPTAEREVKKALRSTLFKYRLHADTDMFEMAHGYVKQYFRVAAVRDRGHQYP